MGSQKGYTVDKDAQGLTKRDRQVLSMLGRGCSREEIQRELNINKSRFYQIRTRLINEHHIKVPATPPPTHRKHQAEKEADDTDSND